MKFHPIADIFPLMEGAEFSSLVEDIKTNGQREPIVLFEDKILDGRNRWRACKEAKVEPKTKEYRGSDPLAFVISLNLKRRHLDESQRAMVGARIANLEAHRPGKETRPNGRLPQPAAASALNVATRSIGRARVVLDHGAPSWWPRPSPLSLFGRLFHYCLAFLPSAPDSLASHRRASAEEIHNHDSLPTFSRCTRRPRCWRSSTTR